MKKSGNIAMKTIGHIVIQGHAGESLTTVANRAKEMAKMSSLSTHVKFDFNGTTCKVSKETNIDWLIRDYTNAHIMGWETIGADCVEEYPPLVQEKLDKLRAEDNKRIEKERSEYQLRMAEEKVAFLKEVRGVEMDISDMDMWVSLKKKNPDGMGGAIMEFAEGWARLMQVEIKEKVYGEISIAAMKEIANNGASKLGFLGISGSMYGRAIAVLGGCWKHGDTLKLSQ